MDRKIDPGKAGKRILTGFADFWRSNNPADGRFGRYAALHAQRQRHGDRVIQRR